MKIPSGYRRLNNGETILGSDIYDRKYRQDSFGLVWPQVIGRTVGKDDNELMFGHYCDTWQILRKIESSSWTDVRDGLPKQHDWYFVMPGGQRGGVAWWGGNDWGWSNVHGLGCDMEYRNGEVRAWMDIPPDPVPSPITIQDGPSTRELAFNKDGSIKAGCITIGSSKMEQIIERRKKAMA